MMIFDLGNLQDGDTFLIHGAGGGVGTAAIQLAKQKILKLLEPHHRGNMTKFQTWVLKNVLTTTKRIQKKK